MTVLDYNIFVLIGEVDVFSYVNAFIVNEVFIIKIMC
jgi:hypothetical protein